MIYPPAPDLNLVSDRQGYKFLMQVLFPDYKDSKCLYCKGTGFRLIEIYDRGKIHPRSEVHECVFCGGTGNAIKPVLPNFSFKL